LENQIVLRSTTPSIFCKISCRDSVSALEVVDAEVVIVVDAAEALLPQSHKQASQTRSLEVMLAAGTVFVLLYLSSCLSLLRYMDLCTIFCSKTTFNDCLHTGKRHRQAKTISQNGANENILAGYPRLLIVAKTTSGYYWG
jgi:hypothetical protein